MSADYKKSLASTYKKDAVETASPGRLVLMLYDGALRFLTNSTEAFGLDDPRQKNEIINNNLIKAQNVLSELQSALDMSVEGDFAKTMFRLYDFMIRQLQQANIKKEPEPIKVVYGMLKDIRDSWDEMLRKQDEGGGSQQPAASNNAGPQMVTPPPAASNDQPNVGGGLDASA